MSKQRSPWREPMMWLVTALPLASVIAGISLLVIASRGDSDPVADPVRRTAQIQMTDLGPHALAQQLGLSAVVRLDDEGHVHLLPVSGEFQRDAPLRISLRHPAHANLDRDLVLDVDELGWKAAVAVDGNHDWNVQLSPHDGQWRLQGRIPRGQRAAHLKPALSEP